MLHRGFRFLIFTVVFVSLVFTLTLVSSANVAPLSGTFGDDVTWVFDPDTGILSFSGSGPMRNTSENATPWFYHNGNIKSIIIEPGITSIGRNAFFNMSGVTSVSIPEGIETIGWGAFRLCDGLTEVVLPEGVTHLDNWCFEDCRNLKYINIPSTVTRIGGNAFYGCDNLSEIHITDLAAWCSIEFQSDDANPLYCGGKLYLNDILIEDLVTPEGVTSIGDYAFFGYLGLKSVYISDCVTEIGEGSFGGCRNLNLVYMADSVQLIESNAFQNCTSLTDVFLSNNLKRVRYFAFAGSTNIASVYISDLTAFCNIVFDDNDSNPLQYADRLYVNGIYSPVLLIPEDVTALNGFAFYGYDGLYGVVVPKSVDYLGYNSFTECNYLQSAIFSGDAPSWASPDFTGNVTVYYLEGTEGWGVDPWNRYYCAPISFFDDVSRSSYYFDSVLWATLYGITNGVSDTKFAPDEDCTRGQIVTFLWRAFGSPEPLGTTNPFTDVSSSAYYYKAVLWAVENGITTGTGKGKFSPNDSCTRGQVATFLWRAVEEPMAVNPSNPFEDLNSNSYYYDAVLWAVEMGVTNGTGEGRFSPDKTCTRGQIVTFLSRLFT